MAGAGFKPPLKGAFISVEGGDGAGKTTQIEKLADALRGLGHEVVTTREPGGSLGAEAIRQLLVTGDEDRWSPLTEALLMYAARADHLEKTIEPALNRGAVVITDRFADSTMAYQGVAGALGPQTVEALHKLVIGERGPDLTLILDAPIDQTLSRADTSDGEARFENKGDEFQRKVRQGFLDIADAAPRRCAVIDARGGIGEVAARINEIVKARLPHLYS